MKLEVICDWKHLMLKLGTRGCICRHATVPNALGRENVWQGLSVYGLPEYIFSGRNVYGPKGTGGEPANPLETTTKSTTWAKR